MPCVRYIDSYAYVLKSTEHYLYVQEVIQLINCNLTKESVLFL